MVYLDGLRASGLYTYRHTTHIQTDTLHTYRQTHYTHTNRHTTHIQTDTLHIHQLKTHYMVYNN